MTKPPENSLLPAHLRPLTIEIPRSWTPEQALAVFELIDDVREKIWAIHGCRIQEALREQSQGGHAGDSADALDPSSI
jgi:hypothetical protein